MLSSHFFLIPILLVMVAGLINGSFASPIKFIKGWERENSWMFFGLFAFFVLPLVTMFLLSPDSLMAFKYLPVEKILIIILGGLVFGIGQVFLANAFGLIGIGLGFIINISLGTAGTSFFSMFLRSPVSGAENFFYVFRLSGILLFFAVIIIGVCCAVIRRDALKTKKSFILEGVFFAGIAGIASIGQGLAYLYASPAVFTIARNVYKTDDLSSNILCWSYLFFVSFIPFFFYFLYWTFKRGSFKKIATKDAGKNFFLTFSMGGCYWISLAFYSRAANLVADKSQIFLVSLWAVFMIFVIMGALIWSFVLREWKSTGKAVGVLLLTDLFLICIAVMSISYSISLSYMTKSLFLK